MSILSMIVITLCSSISLAGEKLAVTGDVFDLSGKTKLFDYKRYVEPAGATMRMRNEYTDLSGQSVVVERLELVNDTFKVYSVEQKQTKESGTVLVRDDKVLFSYTDANGKKSESVESLSKDFVVGMNLIPYIYEHWDSIVSGTPRKIRLGVWQRQETIGFKVEKSSETTVAQSKKIVLKMSPSNFIIARLVDPIFFTFDGNSKHLIEIKGRTQPKIKEGSRWKDLDALIKYQILPQDAPSSEDKMKKEKKASPPPA